MGHYLGDLHDGNGLSDAALPNGVLSNPIFDEVEYDLLTIGKNIFIWLFTTNLTLELGNHELYVTEIAYETFANFSKVWGEKYLTSNVQIINPATGAFEYIGNQYRYFTTAHGKDIVSLIGFQSLTTHDAGLRIMSFGVLYDFTGNSNVSKVIKAATMVTQQWFVDAINFDEPIDMFLLIGHNPVRTTDYSNTLGLVHNTIRSLRPAVPIQVFGGHSHIRDFQVYDSMSTALESGKTNCILPGPLLSQSRALL